MTDAGFSISPDKAARYARPLPADPDTGKPQARTPELARPLKFECGAVVPPLLRRIILRFLRCREQTLRQAPTCPTALQKHQRPSLCGYDRGETGIANPMSQR